MINPTTYEGYGTRLRLSAEILTLAIGGTLAYVWRRVINDPDAVHDMEEGFLNKVREGIDSWNSSWRKWITEDLAKAYRSGITHTEKELEQLVKAHNVKARDPVKDISEATILRKQSSMKYEPPKKAREILKKYPKHLTFYEVFAAAAYEGLEGTNVQVLRSSRDLYRDISITAGESSFKDTDTFTRREMAQRQLNDYAQRGIHAVTYRDGRRMPLDSYAEMVGRTTSGHAAIQASLNRYEEYGYDLVRVSSHFRACPLCTPWEGKVLSQSGESEKYPALDEAIDDGLFHPNCAHDINPYFPGVSPEQEIRVDPDERELIDEHGYSNAQQIAYDAQERQRAIERHIRDWKRKESVALTKDDKEACKAKIREWQREQRKHLKANPFLRRKYEREQVKRAY